MSRLRVVVVGSGLAGLSCAEALASSHLQVTVLTAGSPGRDGATHRVAFRAPWLLLSAPETADDEQRFFAELQARGEGAARPELTRVLAGEAAAAARDLVQALDLCPLDDGPRRLPGDSEARARRHRPALPGPLLQLLLGRCLRHAVRFEPHRWVVGFGTSAGRCTEVLAVEVRTGRLVAEPADAVILACGGVGAMFPVSTAPLWCRGSAIALGGLVGAPLHRPELTQALPVLRRGGFFPSSDSLLHARVVAGDRLLEAAPDLRCRTLQIAAALRRGEKVWLHPADGGAGLPGGDAGGERNELELTVALHHGIGGIAIDAWGRSSIPGLYACGEAAGGTQGVRRTMGTGLLEARIFGLRAANAASRDLDDGLGPAPRTEDRVLGCRAAAAAELSHRLGVTLGPLVAMRPRDEVAHASDAIAEWPEEDRDATPSPTHVRGWLEGSRLLAARGLLAAELAERSLGVPSDR